MSYLSMHIQIHILDSQFSHRTTKSETKVKLIHIIYVLYNIYYNQTKRKLKRKLPYFASKLSFDWYEFEVILILQNFKIFVAKISCNSKKIPEHFTPRLSNKTNYEFSFLDLFIFCSLVAFFPKRTPLIAVLASFGYLRSLKSLITSANGINETAEIQASIKWAFAFSPFPWYFAFADLKR